MNTTVHNTVQLFLDRPRKASTQRFYENHLNLFLKHVGSLKLALFSDRVHCLVCVP